MNREQKQKILEKLPEELVEKEIRRLLFERDYTMIEQEINSFRRSRGKRKRRRTKAGPRQLERKGH